MNKYKYLYLFWLLPAYLLFLTLHQVGVYYNLTDTYENGTSYTSEIVEFQIKQIASQTNGFIVLRFETKSGETVEQKLTLPIELASAIKDLSVIPVRYQQGAAQDIVIMPTYAEHRSMVLSNAAISFIGFLMGLIVAILAHRFARNRMNADEEELVIEQVE